MTELHGPLQAERDLVFLVLLLEKICLLAGHVKTYSIIRHALKTKDGGEVPKVAIFTTGRVQPSRTAARASHHHKYQTTAVRIGQPLQTPTPARTSSAERVRES